MIEQIDKNLFIEVEDPDEEFSIIGSGEELFYNSNQKMDEFLYLTQDYCDKDTSFGQKYFYLKTYTLQDYYELIGHLCASGYDKRIKQEVPDLLKYNYLRKVEKKVLWSLSKIKNNPEEFKNYRDLSYLDRYEFIIKVLIDYNKLENWRNFLKQLSGFKCEWLYISRQPNITNRFIKNDYIIK